MTNADKQSLTGHLAEKVCGRHEEQMYWCGATGDRVISVHVFEPLTDPRDTELVMAAWRDQGGEVSIVVSKPRVFCSAYTASAYARIENSEMIKPWTEAVCLAIGRASGWEGERS